MTKWVMVVALLMVWVCPAYAQDNTCMDCIQNQTRHEEPDGRVWFESDAVCCHWPCYGFDEYELRQGDRGWGCLTRDVSNEVVVGDICDSNEYDLGCPEEPPPDDGGSGWGTVINPGSPILIDLGRDSYRLTSVADGVWFDLRNEGRAIRTAWTRGGTDIAFLALDRNGNGRVDNGAELFGNFTPLRSGAVAQHGYEALSEFDEDADGVIDASDAVWEQLLLWTDRNHDGVSTSDELQRASESTIVSIETDALPVGRRDQWGNEFRYMAHVRVRRSAAVARLAFYDVFFRLQP